MPVSRSTVLRPVEVLPAPEAPAPRVAGADECATRKGRAYGTVLVDVECRRPVDLLPGRGASSLAEWPADRPGIEAVCRDRPPFFAQGAGPGAPEPVLARGEGRCAGRRARPGDGCGDPAGAGTGDAAGAYPVEQLRVAAEDGTGYDRSKFRHRIDTDGDGCSTRSEVLLVEAVEAPEVDSRCRLTGGRWYSVYDDTYVDGARGLDIDHLVPLAEAWDSQLERTTGAPAAGSPSPTT